MTTEVKLGRWSYIGDYQIHDYDADGEITVGDFCSIASDVQFLVGGMHENRRVSTFPWAKFSPDRGRPAFIRGPITIGNDVWICRGARILGGATIESGAIVAAYAVVAGHVPAYHLAVGNPAVCKPRVLHGPHIEALLRIAWWEWDDLDPRLFDVERLTVDEFVAKHDPEGSRQ